MTQGLFIWYADKKTHNKKKKYIIINFAMTTTVLSYRIHNYRITNNNDNKDNLIKRKVMLIIIKYIKT